jgi:hypothetical protein
MNCCFEGDPSPIFDFVVRVVERAFLGELGAVVCEPVWYPTEQQLIYVSACNSFAFVAYSLPLSPTANSTTRMFRAAQPQCLGRVSTDSGGAVARIQRHSNGPRRPLARAPSCLDQAFALHLLTCLCVHCINQLHMHHRIACLPACCSYSPHLLFRTSQLPLAVPPPPRPPSLIILLSSTARL